MLERIAKSLHAEVFRHFYGQKVTLFLCGKSLDEKDSLRARIAKEFEASSRYSHRYEFVYPEQLFEELLTGHFHQDLLSLEQALAESVDAVVLIPESWGAVAELGAFANHEELRQKLVCVQEKRHRKSKSFISYGPIRLLKDAKAGRIVYIDPANLRKAVADIKRAVGEIRRRSPVQQKKLHAINADRFLLPCIYVFEQPDHRTLRELVRHAASIDEKTADAIVAAGLSVMSKQGHVARSPKGLYFGDKDVLHESEGYRLTASGLALFGRINQRGRWNHYYDLRVLDRIRIEIITATCRRRQAFLAS